MAKKPKTPTLDSLDARLRALEAHNGWTPGEPHEDTPAEPEPPAEPPAEPDAERTDK